MEKKKTGQKASRPRWMTECDVIRYNLKIPEKLKEKLKKEALNSGMDMSSYVCGILAGEVRRKGKR
ncbi:MAG: hypothetical protein JSU90_02845 [Nitrospiraceae bacterium]|nr:MAG: hypothetical protein JSU90_02845 [Nitrospiraceae bacterium]